MKFANTLYFIAIIVLVPITLFFSLLLRFSQSTKRSPAYFLNLMNHSLFFNQINDKPLNFLILGLDPRHDWLENTETTDTIIVANLKPADFEINLVSLPRDLWDYSRETKINDIYQNLKKQSQTQLIPSAFSSLIGTDITHYLVINTQNLIDFVKLTGGVDVYLDQGFKDTSYPNPDYINQVGSTAPPYITIEFPSGSNHLDDSNITEFVRSRKGSENSLLGGTDLGRIKRQQLLIGAIFSKLSSGTYLQNPVNFARLYNFWQHSFETNIPDQLISDLLFKLLPRLKTTKISTFEVPVFPSNTNGAIYHPDHFTGNRWVFLPLSPDYSELRRFISDSFAP